MRNIHKISVVIILLIVTTIALFFIRSKINYDNKINTKKMVTLYGSERCKYCIMAKEYLEKYNIKYQYIKLEENVNLYEKLMSQTGQRTIPYIFVDDKFIGGCQDLKKFQDW